VGFMTLYIVGRGALYKTQTERISRRTSITLMDAGSDWTSKLTRSSDTWPKKTTHDEHNIRRHAGEPHLFRWNGTCSREAGGNAPPRTCLLARRRRSRLDFNHDLEVARVIP
jgi:hypothetical protein